MYDLAVETRPARRYGSRTIEPGVSFESMLAVCVCLAMLRTSFASTRLIPAAEGEGRCKAHHPDFGAQTRTQRRDEKQVSYGLLFAIALAGVAGLGAAA